MLPQYAPISTLVMMAERAEAEFRAVYDAKGEQFKKEQNIYRNEIGVKLRQITYNLKRIAELLEELSNSEIGEARHTPLLKEISFYTEAFYWFAWRTRQAFGYAQGFSSFQCDGVRAVRNHLMEHPEKHDGLKQAGLFGVGPGGPMIKHPAVDNGLFENAREFYGNLIAMLERSK